MEEKNKKIRTNYRIDYDEYPRLGWMFKILNAKGISIDDLTKKDESGHSLTGHSPMYYYHCIWNDNMSLKEIDALLGLVGIKTEYKLVNKNKGLNVPGASLGGGIKMPRYNHVYNEQRDEYVKCRASFIDEALAKRNMTKMELARDINRTRQNLYHMWTKDTVNMLFIASICEAEDWELVIILSDETGKTEELHLNPTTTEKEKSALKYRSVVSKNKWNKTAAKKKTDAADTPEM